MILKKVSPIWRKMLSMAIVTVLLIPNLILATPGVAIAGVNQWTTTGGPEGENIKSLVITSDNTVYAGTNNGVFKLPSGESSWQQINDGLTETQVLSLAIAPDNTIYVGIKWHLFGDLFNQGGVYKLLSGASNWQEINTGLPNTDSNTDSIYSLVVAPDGTVYAGNVGRVYKLPSGASNWQEISDGLSVYCVNSLAITSDNTVYAGTEGGIYKLPNGVSSWQEINSGIPDSTSFDVKSLAIATDGTIYAGMWQTLYFGEYKLGGIYKLPSGSSEWQQINIGLTNTDVSSLAISSDNTIYAGTNDGIFKLPNSASNWQQISTGLSNTYVKSLVIAPDNTIYAGTWGNGVYSYTDTSPPTTTASTEPSEPDGTNDWYKTMPVITLSANETSTTYYQWDSTSDEGWTDYTVPLDNMSEGTHSLYFFSADSENNTETVKSQDLKLDITQPTVTINSPASGSTISGTVSVGISSEDTVSGIEKIFLYVDSTQIAEDNSLPYSFNLNTAHYSNSSHTLKVRAYDMARNYRDTEISVTISNSSNQPSGGGGSPQAPTTIKAPTNLKATASVSDITLSWDKVDSAAGYNVYRKEGSGLYARINSGSISSNTYIDLTAKAETTYTYYVTALGSDGNESDKSNEVTASLSTVKPETVFSDVPQNAWYTSFVSRLVLKGIIGGYTDNTFKPEKTISRAEFAKMIVLAMGWELENPETPSFNDVSNNYWAYQYIETAKKHGSINGYSDDTFKPEKEITRAEIAAIIAKTLKLINGSSALKDIGSHWAKEFINSCVRAGIIGGYSNGTFKPGNTATRAEAAKMIFGTMKE